MNMEDVTITNEDLVSIVKSSLPKLLKDVFERSYDNPLKDAISKSLKSVELQNKIDECLVEIFEDLKNEVDFKVFIKEALVNSVMEGIKKNNK